MENQQVVVRSSLRGSAKPRFDIDRGDNARQSFFTPCHSYCDVFTTIEIKSSTSPFLFLSVDLPPPPLFQDAVEKNIIPQVSIQSVLSKYDGRTTQGGIRFSISLAGHSNRHRL